MSEKRIDESWKEQAEKEKRQIDRDSAAQSERSRGSGGPPPNVPGFDQFLSSLVMEALIAFGDMAHPVTQQKHQDLRQAKYLIDLLEMLEAKTKGNLTGDEERILEDALYQLRMRYLNATQAPTETPPQS